MVKLVSWQREMGASTSHTCTKRNYGGSEPSFVCDVVFHDEQLGHYTSYAERLNQLITVTIPTTSLALVDFSNIQVDNVKTLGLEHDEMVTGNAVWDALDAWKDEFVYATIVYVCGDQDNFDYTFFPYEVENYQEPRGTMTYYPLDIMADGYQLSGMGGGGGGGSWLGYESEIG